MSLLDFILNLAALLLWLNWRTVAPATTSTSGAAILSLPKRAAPPIPRAWYLAALIGLLLLRALFYWQAGPQLGWNPGIALGPTLLFLRSDFLGRMLLYSAFSFATTLGIFYLFLLTLSVVNPPGAEVTLAQSLVKLHLGPLGRWPVVVRLLLPLVAVTALWCSLNPLLLKINLVPPVPPWHLLAQGAVIGLAVYGALKFLVVGLLLLHVLNSYVYLGNFAFWDFVNTTSQAMLKPLKPLPLRIGRVDLAPVAGILLVLLVVEFGQRGLGRIYP